MACCLQVLSRFVPARFAPPRAAAVLTSSLHSTNESSHFNARRDTVLQTTPALVPDGQPSRVLRIGYSASPGFRHSNEYFLHLCQPLQGFGNCHIATYIHHITRAILQVVRVEFNTEADATRAAGSLSTTSLNNSRVVLSYLPHDTDPHPDEDILLFERLQDLSSLTVMDEDAVTQPARKKAKLTTPMLCRICANGITGPYSKPCLRCKKPWCLDCVKTWFTMATKDFERMPARCCNIVMHHGVAGGTLSTVEYEQYKLRYDEQTTANPLYCPVPTCSTFIPPRLIDSTQSTVTCTVCATSICTKCKQRAATDHVCEEEAAAIQIKAFNYKICPKCGTAVMKMYGCPHVRCACGAHVCWDCMRPLAVCYRSPCASAIEDGQYGDEGSDGFTDSEDDTEEAGTIMGIASDTQDADPESTRPAQVEIAGTRNAVHAMLNVFRGRGRRGGAFEERRRVFRTVAQPPLPSVAPETISESVDVPISASENLSPPETSTPTTPRAEITASAIPPIVAAPLDFTNPTVPDNSDEPGIFSHVHEECNRSRGSLCLGESSNITPPDFPAEGLPRQQAPLPDTANPAPADSADNPVPPSLLSFTAGPLALELPFTSSSNIDLHESDFASRSSPAVIPATLVIQNLDDPALLNWEAEPYDFGDEPSDESFDVWGCACTFTKLKKGDVDDHWMNLKYLDCMKCFGEVVLFPSNASGESGRGGSVKRSDKEKLACHCFKCGVVVCAKCAKEKKGVMKGLMRDNGREGD